MRPTNHPLFILQALTRFVPAAVRAGAIGGTTNLKSALTAAPDIARYGSTPARALERAAATVPERAALIDDEGLLSYRQLRDHTRTLARWLIALQQERELDELRVGVMARNGRGIVLPGFARGYAGGHLFLLNIGSSPEQLRGIIEENNINVLFIDDEFADRIPTDIQTGHTVTVVRAATEADRKGLTLAEIIRKQDADTQLPLFPKHGNFVVMSSGTTGIPKGILRIEPRLPLALGGFLEAIPFRPGDTIQLSASLFHSWGWVALQLILMTRSTAVTMRVFDAERCYRQIQDYRCGGVMSSPIFYKQMLDLPSNDRFDTSSLRFLASCGNAVTPSLLQRATKRFGPILSNFYGSTEMALAAAATPQQMQSDPSTAGRIPPGTIVRIYDNDDKPVPTGVTGRIFSHNNLALTGYTNPETPMVTIDGLIEIGDLGYMDAQGFLHVQSRIDDMIIVGGENVHPQSVAEILEDMPGIHDLFAYGVDDKETFKRIAVWVVRDKGSDGRYLTANAIQDWVRERLADHSIPRDVHFVEELPRNAVGKVVPRLLPGVAK